MNAPEIERMIREGIPEAEVTVTTRSDLPEDDHYEALVVAPQFAEMSLVEQHQTVYEALGEHMTRDIHALELTTYAPGELERLDG